MLTITTHTDTGILAEKLLADVLKKDNYRASASKGGFLTGGNVIVCEDIGLQQYLQKKCADTGARHIWAALPFKPLAGVLIQYAYSVLPPEKKKNEEENIFNGRNLVWAIFRLLKGRERTFHFADEVAALFTSYQLYRPDLIEAWNRGMAYTVQNADANFINNEKWQRGLWLALRSGHDTKDEMDIASLYKFLMTQCGVKKMRERIFIFAPLAVAPVHLKTIELLARSGTAVNLYCLAPSAAYMGVRNEIADKREKAWKNGKIADGGALYWDIGNKLTANLGRQAQVLHEQLLQCGKLNADSAAENNAVSPATLLGKLKQNILNENNKETPCVKDDSIVFNNCFSALREVEVLYDYLLDLFVKDAALKPDDIAVLAPNIDNYASAIEIVFDRKNTGGENIIPYKISDRDVRKYDRTAQLLALLFAETGGRYEAPDIAALFEYSRFVQNKSPESTERELLEKWITENAIRHGLGSSDTKTDDALPDYTFRTGLSQLAAGFFMIAENGFSETSEDRYVYCYPDIEGMSAHILGDFACFVNALRFFQNECFDENGNEKEKTVSEWDVLLGGHLTAFFGEDETDFNEEDDNPYQKVMSAWDSIKNEMSIGFGAGTVKIQFSVIKEAMQRALETKGASPYRISGDLSFSNITTLRAMPYKVICFIGMNSGDFPQRVTESGINLMAQEKMPGDKDLANEERLAFLEGVLSAEERLYISWTGMSEKTADELEPSSVVIMLQKNLEEQYGIDIKELTTKHPLQPFSMKYFDGSGLSTFDGRWDTTGVKPLGQDVWQWRMEPEESNDDDTRSVGDLYHIFKDTSKYFLQTVCGIELPEDFAPLEGVEPFVVGKGLEEWMLADLILSGGSDVKNEIKIRQCRGELPAGNFADKIIAGVIEEAEALRRKAEGEAAGTYWIYPGNDKGKHRLRHFLYHLDLNLKNENTGTKIFLKDHTIKLPGISSKAAQALLDALWQLADSLKTRMRPIFPDAAWEYLYNTANSKRNFSKEERLNNSWQLMDAYSHYAKKVTGGAKAFADLGIEDDFIGCSEKLFACYNGVEEG